MDKKHNITKGLTPVLDTFVVTIHEGIYEQEASSEAEGMDVLFAQAQVHCDN